LPAPKARARPPRRCPVLPRACPAIIAKDPIMRNAAQTPVLARAIALMLTLGGALFLASADAQTPPANPGLLFYASLDHSTTADFARGGGVPNFSDQVKIVPNGFHGGALSGTDQQILTWQAPGNIYAQRGTLSFFWRSRTPVGRAPFVLFRVGYADHTSWDMCFLRIDYNGHGFDAFVTDDNLARTRVSFRLDKLPAPDAWTHIAFTWDENKGVDLYVNGKLVAQKTITAVYDSGLDQFGIASRIVSPHQVQSRYNFMRGSDYDELRIYDHALDGAQIAALTKTETPAIPAAARTLSDPATNAEWRLRYGWNRAGDPPVVLRTPVTTIRKVQFTDARDIKEFMWKGTDGIAETTWPGVYNRSRLPGRTDYFPLPDWNVYVNGGKAYTLTLPDEDWNHIEIQGAAYGMLSYAAKPGAKNTIIATRPKGQERTYNQFATRHGGVLTFTNAVQETPIQEIAAYDIKPGVEPNGTTKLSYTIRANAAPDSPDLDALKDFIRGRYMPDERATVVALPDGAPYRLRPTSGPRAAGWSAALHAAPKKMPLVHILIPYEFGASPPDLPLYRSWGYGWENMHDGLDGIAIDLPALHVKPDADGLIALNIQIKDPIWPARDMMDITVAVKPGEARTLWLDTRDRILPNKSFYLTIASASPDFGAASLDGARIRLVFKDRQAALKEHIQDRFTQIKDNWGFLVEEHTASKRERLYQRLVAGMTDLLRVDPDNVLARQYWADITYGNQGALPYVQPTAPKGEPLWAFRQLEDLKNVRHFVNWWIDNRQCAYGDLGGGLSDDTDLVEQWPGLALMGVDSDKIRRSQMRVADAVYKNGMFTDGLSTLMLDELHSYEDGINSNSEAMYLNYGDPKVVERLMTTVRAYHRIISVNPAGHLHINTNWFSGTDSYREGPWEWSKYYSYLVLHPGLLMADFNNDPTGRKYIIGLADGLLAHGKEDAGGHWTFPDEINWRTDQTRGTLPAGSPPMQLFWAAWRWTGDSKYLRPILSGGGAANVPGAVEHDTSGNIIRTLNSLNENLLDALGKRGTWGAASLQRAKSGKASNMDLYIAWEMTGDRHYLETLYGREMRVAAQSMYMLTQGHWWTDRVEIHSNFLQRTRLGGIALERNDIYPGNTVSWRFADPDGAVHVAILMPGATRDHFKVIAYNVTGKPIKAVMTGWNVTAGQWTMHTDAESKTIAFEKTASVAVVFAPKKTTLLEFDLKKAGPPVQTRPDLGIGADDVTMTKSAVEVTVHSLGAKPAPAGTLSIIDAAGKIVASAPTPALPAPLDLMPHTALVKIALPAGFNPRGAHAHVSLGAVKEITQMNNDVALP
jgi:hypothetical protein